MKIADAIGKVRINSLLHRALKFLRASGADDVYTVSELAEALGVSWLSLRLYVMAKEMKPFRLEVARRYFYGSSAALKALRRKLENK